MRITKNLTAIALCISMTACSSTLEKLDEIGTGPKLEKQKNPVEMASYQPVKNWPTPIEPAQPETSNSLWQPGARAFFKDQRATKVGDILTVQVKISDKADLNNKTSNARTNAESVDKPELLGLTKDVYDLLPGNQDEITGTKLLDMGSNSSSSGDGKIGRKEDIETKIAATITQVMPNGNLEIYGVQQVRVNHELREVSVAGVIRPEDISSENTILSEQIAEARISYGGRGIISDAQQPRYGNQIFDIISPF